MNLNMVVLIPVINKIWDNKAKIKRELELKIKNIRKKDIVKRIISQKFIKHIRK